MRKLTPRRLITAAGNPMRQFMSAATGYECQGFIVHPGPDLPGFSGAGQGVHTCSADAIATKILGLRT